MIKNTLFERRSIRSYKAEQIKDNELDYVLKAALYAPTGRNFQSTVMVAVQSPQLVSRLSKMNADIMGVDNFKILFSDGGKIRIAHAGFYQ